MLGGQPRCRPRVLCHPSGVDSHDESHRSHTDDLVNLTDTNDQTDRMRDAVGEARAADHFRQWSGTQTAFHD